MIPLAYLAAVLFCLSTTSGQRVAPGVPPQQYQQVPQHHPQQQYQQVPVQHIPVDQFGQPIHQVPQQQVQYQQAGAVPQPVPQQHHQQQVYQQQQQQHPQPQPHHPQVQQVPHGGHGVPHGHGAPHGQQPVLNPANIQHEREHIAEHMDVPIDTSKMSDQELQFHYFKMHDSDNNNKLDGCELIKSLIHWHDPTEGKKDTHGEAAPRTDDALEKLIDPILELMDADRDGFISFAEYKTAEHL